MGVDLRISGAEDLARVAKALKDAGEKELRKELLRGIREAAAPLKSDVQAAARADLPQRGGLAAEVAGSRIGVRTRTSGGKAGVRLEGKRSGRDLKAIDRGRLRHPVFGNREVWVTQNVKPGWWSDTLAKSAPAVRREVVDAMQAVARKVTRG